MLVYNSRAFVFADGRAFCESTPEGASTSHSFVVLVSTHGTGAFAGWNDVEWEGGSSCHVSAYTSLGGTAAPCFAKPPNPGWGGLLP